MLSFFELTLYGLAKAAGFGSIDETNAALVRHAIEWYLIEIIWKRTTLVKDIPSSSLLIPWLPQGVDPEARVLDIVKEKLDLNLYALNDDRVDGLVDYMTTDNVDALHQALEVNPELLHRRNKHMRSLFHEAVVQGKPWAAELLLNKGASFDQRASSGVDTLELAIQSCSIGPMASLLYQRFRQYIILRTMIAYHYAESDCIAVYHAKAQCAEPVTSAEDISLLHLAMEKRYFSLVKILVLNGTSPNSPDSDGMMPLYNHAIEEMRYIKNNFNHRAQVVVPGFVSFLLAAGARPDQSGVDEKSLLADLRRETEQVHPSFSVAGAEIACQCQLAMGEFPIIILRKSDYDLLKEAGALVAQNVTYVVLENKNQLTIHYQKNGFPQTLAGHELLAGRVIMERLNQFIALLYPEFTSHQEKPFKPYVEIYRSMRYPNHEKYIVDIGGEPVFLTQQGLKWRIDSQPMCWSELFKDEAQTIQRLKSIYDGRPIRLDDELVHDMMEAARKAEHAASSELYAYVYRNLQLDTTPENIKLFLYRSTFFISSHLFKNYVVNQPFSGELTFRQILSNAGVALKENYVFKRKSIELEAYGWVKLAEKNKGAIENSYKQLKNPVDLDKPLSEFDILKGIKKVYLYKIKNSINHPKWKDMHVAIRDSLVLGSSTLFLNVIRTNSHMDQLKDTDTYLEVCKLMQTVELSDEAKAELSRRVLALPGMSEEASRQRLRDAVMFLALACDFEQNKSDFILVCFHYFLVKDLSAVEKKVLNDALRLLSKEEHSRLRDRLVAVSTHEALREYLQLHLSDKNCAFIEIVRTSEEDRKVTNTKKFKDLVERLSKPMAMVAEREEKPIKKEWHLPKDIVFFQPNPKTYSANLDMDDKVNSEGFFPL